MALILAFLPYKQLLILLKSYCHEEIYHHFSVVFN